MREGIGDEGSWGSKRIEKGNGFGGETKRGVNRELGLGEKEGIERGRRWRGKI